MSGAVGLPASVVEAVHAAGRWPVDPQRKQCPEGWFLGILFDEVLCSSSLLFVGEDWGVESFSAWRAALLMMSVRALPSRVE